MGCPDSARALSTGVPRSQKTAPPSDPSVGLCPGPCGCPRGGAVSYERGAPVTTAVVLPISMVRKSGELGKADRFPSARKHHSWVGTLVVVDHLVPGDWPPPPPSGLRTILKLTQWLAGTNLSNLARKNVRAHQTSQTE